MFPQKCQNDSKLFMSCPSFFNEFKVVYNNKLSPAISKVVIAAKQTNWPKKDPGQPNSRVAIGNIFSYLNQSAGNSEVNKCLNQINMVLIYKFF